MWGQCESSGETALSLAVSKGRGDILFLLLDGGADINAVFHGKYHTALGTAVGYGDQRRDMVSLLLYRGANIDMVVGPEGTALTAAVISQSTDTVSLLLDRGADINKVGCVYGTALGAAATTSPDMVLLLLDRGANIDAVSSIYGTPLARAAAAKRTDIVSLLLDRGANIDGVGGLFGTALAAAAHSMDKDTVSLLLDRGAKIDPGWDVGIFGTALAAAASGSTDIVSLLLDRGADIIINDGIGTFGTALATAAAFKHADIVSLLLDRGAEINKVGGVCGSALSMAVLAGGAAIVSLLLDRGADIDAEGGLCGTALATAAFSGSTDIVDIVSLVGDKLQEMYFDACNDESKLYEFESLLASPKKFGALMDTTAFTQAAGRGSTEIVSLLLDRGANTGLVGREYGAAFGSAICSLEFSIALLLLERHADVMCIAGHPTALTVYPGALDAIYSRAWGIYPASRAQLITAISKQTSQQNPVGSSTIMEVSPSPFPMPYTWQHYSLYTAHHEGASPSCLSSFNTEFRAGGSITPEQANVPCQELDVGVLWRSLTALVGLNNDITVAKSPWIGDDIRHFVACKFDFGLAYAAARVAWKHMGGNVVSSQRSQWHAHARELGEVRSDAIKIDDGQKVITSPYKIMPRRLWDLKSNRVVDYKMPYTAPLPTNSETTNSESTFWAVSHSWTSDMSPIWTAINQYQWPVPCPKGTNLDDLRSELLTFGAEYVWLDIVCLRQQSGVDCLERLRRDEWKLDVPIIGNIYRVASNIVRYFNGLGVPFSNKGWDDPRHWLQRAWTLQEIAPESNTINGGVPWGQGQILLDSRGEVSGKVIQLRRAIHPVTQLARRVDHPDGCEVYKLAQEMANRHASQPVDKISGLFYLLRTTKLLCYDVTMTSEDFWKQSFPLLPVERKAEILFDYPYRGASEQWFPTWEQMLQWPIRNQEYDHTQYQSSSSFIRNIPGRTSLFIGDVWTIPDVVLHEADNSGKYKVKINRFQFGFYLPYLSQKRIDLEDQPTLTLAIAELEHDYNWVVCRAVSTLPGTDIGLEVAEVNVLRKVGVIRTDSCSELRAARLLRKMDCLFI